MRLILILDEVFSRGRQNVYNRPPWGPLGAQGAQTNAGLAAAQDIEHKLEAGTWRSPRCPKSSYGTPGGIFGYFGYLKSQGPQVPRAAEDTGGAAGHRLLARWTHHAGFGSLVGRLGELRGVQLLRAVLKFHWPSGRHRRCPCRSSSRRPATRSTCPTSTP